VSELEYVQVEASDDGVRIVTLDRPPVNALGRQIVEEVRR
jgi:enoyl-CoA hydratase/carnithine racemase